MAEYFVCLFLLCFLNFLGHYECKEGDNTDNDLTNLEANGGEEPVRSESDYVYWPFASIPFYIDPLHFDHEQSLSIMTALSMFSFKTCLKFAPVLVRPEGNQHVLLIENPNGVRQCQFSTIGHSIDEPHSLVLGYDCLKSPHIDMMIMRALGFPFEHNRAIRNIYIDVQPENVEPAYVELFTKDGHLPMQLRSLPYDINSVMHFGEREFSKNGHRTIIFKDHKVHQIRNGLTRTDIRKIQIVYGPECILRDRQEKIELCQNFPGVARKKREIDTPDPTRSLRVNRNITPPKNVIVEEPQTDNHTYDEVSKSLTELGIENEVQLIVDQVNKVSAMALMHAREKFCNKTKPDLRFGSDIKKKRMDILGIVESVAQYAQSMVDHATANLTEFCEQSRSLELYQRQRAKCPFYNDINCPKTYKSTKSGPVKYSTQHRPLIRQSTKHHGAGLARGQYDSMYRARDDDNATAPENATEKTARRKREVHARKFFVYPINSDAVTNVRRRRDLGDSPMSLSEAAVTTPASIESTTTTERNARKKRDIDTQDFNVAPLILNEMYGIPRRKRDVAESAKSESEVTTQPSTSLTTPGAEAARRKRDVAETTKSEPEVTTETSTTEGTTETSTSTVTESVATETSVPDANDTEKSVANENKTVPIENNNEKSELNENKTETNDKSPRLSEMDVVIVSTDKTGGYVDAEVVSKGDLRMGTRLPRDDSKWAPVNRRHQTPFRRMFRAKFPAETRRRGHFETVNWDKAGTEEDQKEIEDAKRVIREDPDLQIILEGNKAKMLEEKRKQQEEESDVPKKKKERGKSRNKEIEEYEERQKSEYLQKKRKKFADDEESKTVEKERGRNEKRPKKPNRKGVVSEDDDEESEAKVKKPLKTTKDEVSSDEAERLDKQKNFSSKKMAKAAKKTKPVQPAIVQDSEEIPKVLKKPVPEDLESEYDPKAKNAMRGGAEYDDEPKTVKKSSSKYVQSDDEPKTVKKPAAKVLDSDDEVKPAKKPPAKVLESDDEQKTVKKSAKDDTESEDEPKSVKKPAKEVSASDESKPAKKPAKTTKTDQNQSQEDESEEIEVSSRRPHFVPRTVDLTRRNKDFYQDRKWPDGIVPYIIQEDPKYDIDDMRRRLSEVNFILKKKTCVQLKEIKPTETNKYEDYLVLDTSPDYVTGRVGGRQVSLIIIIIIIIY